LRQATIYLIKILLTITTELMSSRSILKHMGVKVEDYSTARLPSTEPKAHKTTELHPEVSGSLMSKEMLVSVARISSQF
jgi:hypothetical protein